MVQAAAWRFSVCNFKCLQLAAERKLSLYIHTCVAVLIQGGGANIWQGQNIYFHFHDSFLQTKTNIFKMLETISK